ncbi:MAG TPA: NfeD family protein [Thermoplasmata archaeon]|nr:NfeD family protein [Thermoplasmata archaeon]
MAAVEVFGLSIYVWIAAVSLLFLIILAAIGSFGVDFGGDADVDLDYGEFTGPGISPLSPPLLATFGTAFGAIGALLELGGWSTVLTAVGASLGALLIAVGMFLFVAKFLVRAQASSDVDPASLVGREGQIMVPIQPGAQGQVLVITPERGRTLLPAVSTEAIPRDAIVEILGFAGGAANVRKKAS